MFEKTEENVWWISNSKLHILVRSFLFMFFTAYMIYDICISMWFHSCDGNVVGDITSEAIHTNHLNFHWNLSWDFIHLAPPYLEFGKLQARKEQQDGNSNAHTRQNEGDKIHLRFWLWKWQLKKWRDSSCMILLWHLLWQNGKGCCRTPFHSPSNLPSVRHLRHRFAHVHHRF